MSSEQYIENLEKQHEELLSKLAVYELQLQKLKRKKSIYPVFRVFSVKVKKDTWTTAEFFITNCDSVDAIRKCLKFDMAWYNKGIEHIKDKDKNIHHVGYKYWRQSINYKWCLDGMCKFFDLNLKKHHVIEIDQKTGNAIFH